VSNTVAIVQQYFVTGWGGLRRQPALATASTGSAPPVPKAVNSSTSRPPAATTKPATATTKPATSTVDGRGNAASRPPTRSQKRRKARR